MPFIRRWSGLTALAIITTLTLTMTACAPPPSVSDDHVIDTRQRSVVAPLCTSHVEISMPCSEIRHTARAAKLVGWRFYPHKGDNHTFQDVEECPATGVVLPCMAVPRHADKSIAGDPTFLFLLT